MPLPIKPLPIVERWDCHQCGVCCRGSRVPLSAEDLARLKEQGWAEHPDFRGTPIVTRDSWLGGQPRLAHRDDGSCVFLLPDGLCRIHKELGFDAKPLVCRTFPLQVVPRDGVAYVTIRRACPSAAADLGRPVSEQLSEARELARESGLAEHSPSPPPIKPGERRAWPATRRVLDALQRLLADERFPVVRRLVHALAFCRLLEQAQTRRLSDEQLGELCQVLEQGAPDESADVFSDRQLPGGAARVLFRQSAAEYVRLHPRFHARGTWRERWRLTWAAWSFVRGRGKLPRLHPTFPDTTFDQLEEPLGRQPPEIYQPFARFVETTALSWSYALSNRAGWSVIESFRALALSYPIGLWLLRWAAAGRQPTVADVLDIITALDRGQGYAPLAGKKHRRRVQLLARLDAGNQATELARLVAWYGR
jgi:lysine-N-methylase